jgi:hypothetical protein
MKKLATKIIIVLISLASLQAFSQAPEGMKYQAVARNASGAVLANTSVTFDISIMQGDAGGPAVYHETHNAATNETGLVSLVIGKGMTGDSAEIIMTLKINLTCQFTYKPRPTPCLTLRWQKA